MTAPPEAIGLFSVERLAPSTARRITTLYTLLAATALAIGVAGVVGWRFDMPALRHPVEAWSPIRPAGGLFLATLGAALCLARRQPLAARGLAGLTLLLALGALLPPLAWLDRFVIGLVMTPGLAAEASRAAVDRTSATPPAAALGFATLAVAFLLAQTPRLAALSQTMALSTLFTSLVPVLGWLYGVPSLSSPLLPSAPAPQAAFGVALLSIAIPLLHPQRGAVGLLSGDTAASSAARLQLAAAFLVPTVLGGVFVYLREAGAVDVDAAVPTFVAALAATLGTSVLWVRREGARAELLERRSIHAMRQTADSSPLMTWMADADGWTHANGALLDFLGVDSKSLLGRAWLDLAHPDDVPGLFEDVGRAMRDRQPFSAELRMRVADGSWRWVLSSGLPHIGPKNEVLGYVGSWVDVTVRKNAEVALRAANRDLENYASSVAHDLRTPLRAIDGFARVLEEDHGDAVGPEGRRVLGIVRRNAQDMGAFIDALLKFSASQLQPPDKRRIDVEAMVRGCVEALGADVGDRRVDFRVGPLPSCLADASLLRQVFLNLLANAVKFTRPRERAVIDIGSVAQEGGETAYFVRDNGVGFDMSNTRRLFGIFQRLHPPGQFEGTGLGLASVARIVAAHGGRVWAEAEPDRGATFFFVIEPQGGPT